MLTELNKLATLLKESEPDISKQIEALAGRYDKMPISTPEKLQHAYKYIMYLKLMKNLDDPTFYHMKRKYLNTAPNIQEECKRELDKLISQDALKTGISSAEIRRVFYSKL